MEIRFWNRYNRRIETEKVYGDAFVRALYGNGVGYWFTHQALSRRPLSAVYGWLQSSGLSAGKVDRFIADFAIPMEQYESGPFASFNDFFIRRFKPGLRPFPSDAGVMGAPAEARYYAFADISRTDSMPVKGLDLNPIDLLGGVEDKERFRNGPCLLARLCPVDYHRFHFPDSGTVVSQRREVGRLHSVNPIALRKNPRLFLQNEREVTVIDTENFGRITYVEVGALCVGKIVQSYPGVGSRVERGQEKGYFLFGGSTVIVYGEAGKWTPSEDMLKNTRENTETYVHLGDAVAIK